MGTVLQASDGLLIRSSGFLFLQAVLLIGVYLALGLYCFRAGTVLFNLLNREEPENGDSNGDSTTSSTLGLP